MKAKNLIAVTALLLTMGVGSAHADDAAPSPTPTETVAPAPEGDPTLIVVLTPPYLGADGQIVGPQAVYPSLAEYFTYSIEIVNNTAIATATVLPGNEASTDLTLTDRSGATDAIVFDPIALPPVPDAVESYPAPAPVAPVMPSPAPVAPAPETPAPAPAVPAPSYAPDAATSERVASGEELAYTGVNIYGLAVGAALMVAGVWFIVAARRRA